MEVLLSRQVIWDSCPMDPSSLLVASLADFLFTLLDLSLRLAQRYHCPTLAHSSCPHIHFQALRTLRRPRLSLGVKGVPCRAGRDTRTRFVDGFWTLHSIMVELSWGGGDALGLAGVVVGAGGDDVIIFCEKAMRCCCAVGGLLG